MNPNQTYTLADFQPRDTESLEWQVIDDCLADTDIIPQAVGIVKPSFFSNPLIRNLWTDIVAEFNEGNTSPGYSAMFKQPKAAMTAYSAWKTKNIESEGRFGITPDEAMRHINILRNEAARRRCHAAALKFLELSNGNEPEGELYAKAADIVSEIEDDTLKMEYTIGEIFNEIAEEVEQRRRDYEAGKMPCVATGFPNLDSCLNGGFKRGQLIVMAARPSVGKTAVALQMMQNAAGFGNRSVFFSIEMMRDELGNRVLYSTDLVTVWEVFSGQMDWGNFDRAVKQKANLPIMVNDRVRDLAEIVSRMTILNRQGRCDFAIVDYLGLINPTDHRIPLYQQIAEVTGTMKATAKRLGIPILLLCQLNRDAAKANEEPQLYHLRDSGAIEQDADIVLMLQTDAVTNGLDIFVRKNRHGESNVKIILKVNQTRSRYEDVTDNPFSIDDTTN